MFWRPLEDKFYEEYILMTIRKYIKEYLVNGIVLCHDYYAVSIYCSCYINYILKILKALSKGYDDFNGKEILEVYKNTLEYLNNEYERYAEISDRQLFTINNQKEAIYTLYLNMYVRDNELLQEALLKEILEAPLDYPKSEYRITDLNNQKIFCGPVIYDRTKREILLPSSIGEVEYIQNNAWLKECIFEGSEKKQSGYWKNADICLKGLLLINSQKGASINLDYEAFKVLYRIIFIDGKKSKWLNKSARAILNDCLENGNRKLTKAEKWYLWERINVGLARERNQISLFTERVKIEYMMEDVRTSENLLSARN